MMNLLDLILASAKGPQGQTSLPPPPPPKDPSQILGKGSYFNEFDLMDEAISGSRGMGGDDAMMPPGAMPNAGGMPPGAPMPMPGQPPMPMPAPGVNGMSASRLTETMPGGGGVDPFAGMRNAPPTMTSKPPMNILPGQPDLSRDPRTLDSMVTGSAAKKPGFDMQHFMAALGAGMSQLSGPGMVGSFGRGMGSALKGGQAHSSSRAKSEQEERKLSGNERYRDARLDIAKGGLENQKRRTELAAQRPGAWNKPAHQIEADYQRALAAGLKRVQGEIGFNPSASPITKAEKAEHEAARAKFEKAWTAEKGRIDRNFTGGQQQPGGGGMPSMGGGGDGSQAMPFQPTSREEFEQRVKPGQWFINPADGRLLRRKGGSAAAPMTAPDIDVIDEDEDDDL